jgi:RNA polymerase sigma factor (TIGR02999 family)
VNSEGRPHADVTDLLQLVADGQKDAEAELIAIVYGELRQIARRLMRREGAEHTLQTTALVHEAYMRLARPQATTFKNRAHFFAVAATVMRRVLVDYARAKHADKRDGGQRVTIDDAGFAVDPDEPERVLAIDAALSRLSALDQRQGRIVEMRFFAGMSVEEDGRSSPDFVTNGQARVGSSRRRGCMASSIHSPGGTGEPSANPAAARWSQTRDIFFGALDAEESDRISYVQRACAGDADLEREVLRLVHLETLSETFLERPAIARLAPLIASTEPMFRPGDRLAGRYRVVEMIGRGGMVKSTRPTTKSSTTPSP